MAPQADLDPTAQTSPAEAPAATPGLVRRAFDAALGLVRSPREAVPPLPRPALQRPDTTRPWVAGLGEPSLTLLENGPALSVLLAEGCHEDALPGRLVLDAVTWARGDESVSTSQAFPAVRLFHDGQGWVAEDPATGRVFPGLGRPAFPTTFLPWREYQSLRQHAQAPAGADLLLACARIRFGLPPERLPRRLRSLVPPPATP